MTDSKVRLILRWINAINLDFDRSRMIQVVPWDLR